jgi:hypothetical protein
MLGTGPDEGPKYIMMNLRHDAFLLAGGKGPDGRMN